MCIHSAPRQQRWQYGAVRSCSGFGKWKARMLKKRTGVESDQCPFSGFHTGSCLQSSRRTLWYCTTRRARYLSPRSPISITRGFLTSHGSLNVFKNIFQFLIGFFSYGLQDDCVVRSLNYESFICEQADWLSVPGLQTGACWWSPRRTGTAPSLRSNLANWAKNTSLPRANPVTKLRHLERWLVVKYPGRFLAMARSRRHRLIRRQWKWKIRWKE